MAIVMLFFSLYANLVGTAMCDVKVIDHDAVKTRVESESTLQSAFHKHMPYLELTSASCMPFPVVTRKGEVSGGLKVGDWDNGVANYCWCPFSQGYVRLGSYDGWTALVYVFYFPRESTLGFVGFRHSFQAVVLWFKDDPTTHPDAKPIRLLLSDYSGFVLYEKWDTDNHHPLVRKAYNRFTLDHIAWIKYSTYNLVTWQELTDDARQSMNDYSFGPRLFQEFPINDVVFEVHLKNTYYQMMEGENPIVQ